MFGVIKTFFAGHTTAVYAGVLAAIFLFGFVVGIKVQRTLYRAEQAAIYEATERQRVYLAAELDKVVKDLKAAENTIKIKNTQLRAKVRDAAKTDPAYQCPVPVGAIELLNK